MNKETKQLVVLALFTYAVFFAIIGFICWYNHSLWGLLLVIFIPNLRVEETDEETKREK